MPENSDARPGIKLDKFIDSAITKDPFELALTFIWKTRIRIHFFAQRRAHVPLGAGSSVTHGFRVVVTEGHLNETDPSGYVARLVSQS